MTTNEPVARSLEDPEGPLARALREQFLRARGLDAAALRAMPEAEAKRILADASVYVATKLAEVEARAHFVHEIHGRE